MPLITATSIGTLILPLRLVQIQFRRLKTIPLPSNILLYQRLEHLFPTRILQHPNSLVRHLPLKEIYLRVFAITIESLVTILINVTNPIYIKLQQKKIRISLQTPQNTIQIRIRQKKTTPQERSLQGLSRYNILNLNLLRLFRGKYFLVSSILYQNSLGVALNSLVDTSA